MLTKQDNLCGVRTQQTEVMIALSPPEFIQTYLFYYSTNAHLKQISTSLNQNINIYNNIAFIINNKLQIFYKNQIEIRKTLRLTQKDP